jgi:hypothetical protein
MSSILWQTRLLSISDHEGGDWEFRIEVFERLEVIRCDCRFRVRVWMSEPVRLSRIPLNETAEFIDGSVLTLSDMFDSLEFDVETADEAAEACFAAIRERLTDHSEHKV